MKRRFTISLLVLTAIVCVVATGCGSRKEDNTSGNNAGSTTQGTMNNGSSSSGNGASGSIMGEAGQDLEHAGDAIMDGVENAGDAITGNNGSSSGNNNGSTSGVPYNDLLDDGKVTDRDGNLNNDAGGSTSMARSR